MSPEKQEELLRKIASRRQVIIKNGTYTINKPEDIQAASMQQEVVPSNDASASSLTSEQDDKVAEILGRFASNIQDNVSSLFDNF